MLKRLWVDFQVMVDACFFAFVSSFAFICPHLFAYFITSAYNKGQGGNKAMQRPCKGVVTVSVPSRLYALHSRAAPMGAAAEPLILAYLRQESGSK